MFRLAFVRFFALTVVLAGTIGTSALGGDLELIESRKIWDAAAHNAFTDLVRYQGKWVCGFREAPAHTGGVKGSQIRVIVSDDARQWESAGVIDDQKRGDIRDAKFGLMPDGRLMLLTATQLFDASEQRHQSHAWFTKDLKNWDGPHDVGDPDIWTWGIRFHQGVGYSIGYRTKKPRYARLYSTKNGEHFDTLVENMGVNDVYPNESVIVFDRDSDKAYCLLRCKGPAQLGVATPPYEDWQWKVADRSIGGPEMIQLPDGRLLAGGRLYDGKVRTSLFWVNPETAELTEALKLPSGGDTSYPGFVIHEDTLYVSYYSSHEGKTSIYLATVKINESDSAEPLAIGSRLEPLVDDYLISQMSGDVHQQLHQPTPGEVVLVTDEPWEGNTSAYFTIFQDDDRYRMYYRGSHSGKGNGNAEHPEFTCYAESTDGIHWTKPDLGIVEFNGSKHNNIILEGLGTHCFVAFKDTRPDCPPESRYKGISRGRPVGEKGLYVFESADGIHWSLMADHPVITQGAFDSQNLAFWDSFTKRYVDYHRTFTDGKRTIVTCHSDDYLNWTDPVPLEYPGSPAQELYTNAIRVYPRAEHIRVGFPTRYLPNEGSRVEPLFMSSRDGIRFNRWDEPVIPETAPEDRMGNRSNYMANGLVSLPDNDREYSVYATEAYYKGPDSRLRRFTYRIDGFVSVRAGDEGGDLLTKPLTFSGAALNLNYATQDAGQIRVSLESPSGEVLAQSKPLTGDETAHRVDWPAEIDLQALQGRTVQLRFSMKNADLYSIQSSR